VTELRSMVQNEETCLHTFGQKTVKEWTTWTTYGYADTEC